MPASNAWGRNRLEAPDPRTTAVTKATPLLWMLLASTAGLATEQPGRPDDVTALIHRVGTCAHLAGEFGTDDPEREQALARSWDESRCDDAFLGEDIKRLRQKYIHHPSIIAPLDEELRRISEELGIEF